MANRYWVGTGNPGWDNNAGSKWATSSGGAGGASAPGPNDDVFIDAASDAGDPPYCIVTLTDNIEIKSLTLTGFVGQLVIGATPFTLTINGAGLTIPGSMSFVNSGIVKFTATTGSHTVAGVTGSITVDGVGGTFTLSASGSPNFDTLTITGGTVNLDDADGTTIGSIVSSGSGVRALNLAGTITFKDGAGYTIPINFTGSNFTFNAGTSSLVMGNTDAPAKEFRGGGKTFYDITFNRSHIVRGSNTFHDFTISGATNPDPMIFEAGSTQTITGTFTAEGGSGNMIYLESGTPGSPATIEAETTVLDYLSVTDMTAVGGPEDFEVAHGVDVGGNFGWNFLGASQHAFFSFFGSS